MRLRVTRAIALCLVMVVAGCSAGAGAGTRQDEIRLVQQPWEDLVVENQIVSQILEELGYRTRVMDLSVSIGAQTLADGETDAYLGNWWPSQKPTFQHHLDKGEIEILGTLVTGTTYAPAVPKFVAEQYDVRSLADLVPKSDLFHGEFLGIESGTPGNQYILDAIEDNAYGLGEWQLVESSTTAMLAEVKRRVDEGTPVVFLGWEPHWMNVEWDLVYLDDPEQVWPGAGEIRVATRAGLEADNPDVARLLSQMKIDRETASEWIFQLGKEGASAETIAREWIESHPDEVDMWLQGVRTAQGEPARDAL